MAIDTYKKYLDDFFTTILEYRHSTNRLNTVLKNDVLEYSTGNKGFISMSALIISDWSGPTDRDWEVNFHSGITRKTLGDAYEQEVKQMLSRECCLMYAQSFEAFERLVKDCLFYRANYDKELKRYIVSKQRGKNEDLLREAMPGGRILLQALKKAGGEHYSKFSETNNINIRFDELWAVLSEVRHSIIHSRSILNAALVRKSKHHYDIFIYLFGFAELSDDLLLIEFDVKQFNRLLKKFSEFAYQIFKILTVEEVNDREVKHPAKDD
jgi:hypothetical protein